VIAVELEPGPFAVRDPLPLGPRVSRDGLFESLLEPLAVALGASDPVLAPAQGAIATNSDDGLEATYLSTVGVAETVTADQAGAADDQTSDQLVDAGGGADAYRGSVLRYLPQPDASIEGDFIDAPPPTPPRELEPPDRGPGKQV
jgi:hypothetical protein